MKEKNSVGSEVKDWVVSIAAAIVLALLIRTFIVELYIVDGPSMRPTLQHDERLVVNKFIYHWRNPEKGEVIPLPARPEPRFYQARHSRRR